MKILPQQVDAFIKNPSVAIHAVLIYGPDNGLVKERFTALSRAIVTSIDDPFSVNDFSYNTLKDDPVLLANALAALSFFGGRRLVRITDAPTTLTPALLEIIEQHKNGAFLIISCGELSASSNIRKLCEAHDNLAAIACYNDEGAGLRKVIETHLGKAGMTFDNAVIPYLLQSLAGDRLLIHSELDKLILYMGTNQHIRFEDAAACIAADPLDASLDALCASIASRNGHDVQQHLSMLFAESISPIAITRTVANYFMRLYTVRNLIAQGIAENQAMAQLRPPVFFKQTASFQQHVRAWSEAGLLAVIRSLNKIETECKKTGTPSELLCKQYLTLLGAPRKAR
jgi:DNA polymerase-3 subunit delta